MKTFSELGLQSELLEAINDMGFITPSDIQLQTIPLLLESDTDLVALAQTGTGKTAAFGFPLLQKIDIASRVTQGLILAPTRELCLQITNEMQLYGKNLKGLNIVAIYGGASITEQANQIRRGAQIIVATPGRMKDMIRRKMVDISRIEYSILDEADEMLNMGFYEDITDILSFTPQDKSTWLFSATMPKEVATIAKEFMHNPKEVTVGAKNVGSSQVSHEFYLVGSRDRYEALKRLADANPDIFSVVFCRTKRDTQKVAEKLIEDGYNASALHGDLSQNQRDLVMKSFRNKQIQMLVATDVAARGIDVEEITHVINYQLPDEIETYTHRSGRTGRAGKTGISMVIITKSELRKIKHIEKIIQKSFQEKSIPSGMEICEKQLFSLANKVHDTKVNHDIDTYLPKINELFETTSKEELIKKFFSVEFSRFYNYYQKAPEVNVEKSRGNEASGESVRFFINVGRKDGYDWMKLKDFIRDMLQLGKEDVYKVDVLDTFSFFNLDEANKDKPLEFFKDFKIEGRFINVEVTENKGQRKQSGGKRKKSKSFDKFKNDGPRNGGSRGGNKSNRKDKKGSGEFAFSRPRKSRRK